MTPVGPISVTLARFKSVAIEQYGAVCEPLHLAGPRGDEVLDSLVRTDGNGEILMAVVQTGLEDNELLELESLRSMSKALGIPVDAWGEYATWEDGVPPDGFYEE